MNNSVALLSKIGSFLAAFVLFSILFTFVASNLSAQPVKTKTLKFEDSDYILLEKTEWLKIGTVEEVEQDSTDTFCLFRVSGVTYYGAVRELVLERIKSNRTDSIRTKYIFKWNDNSFNDWEETLDYVEATRKMLIYRR